MSENFYYDPRELLKQVDNFSNFKLSRRDDLQIIFTEGVKPGNKKLFEELIFTAKYIRGLFKVMKMGEQNPEVKSMEYIKNDLTKNVEKVIEQIRKLIASASQPDQKYVEENFLRMTASAFRNLNELLADLEWTKMYLNELKRS